MTSRFRRLQGWLPRRLICRFPFFSARDATRGFARDVVLVVSPTAPHLRRLTVYRRRTAPSEPPRVG